MIKRFKKYLLAHADDAGYGFLVGCLPLFLLGAVFMLVFVCSPNATLHISMMYLGFAFMIASWPVGILLALLFRFFRRKYIAHVSDYLARLKNGYSDEIDTSGVLLLKVEHDKVVDSGEAVWSKGREGVYPILLPCVSEKEFTLLVPFAFGRLNVKFHLKVHLTHDFEPQELYDHVIGHRFLSVKSWLIAGFCEAIRRNTDVRQGLLKIEQTDPYLLADAVQKCLVEMDRGSEPWDSLNNISIIQAAVIIEPGQLVYKDVYNIYTRRRALD